MNSKTIFNLKIIRLVISILMIITTLVYYFLKPYYMLPKQELILTIEIGLFVFLLGMQYKIENKNETYTTFLMFFSVIMIVMSLVGLFYV